MIGAGFTGTSALHQLVANYPVREITVYETSGVFGPGYPYRADDCRDYLMNNTTDSLCLEPGNRRAFLEWLQERSPPAAEPDPRGHQPRAEFGEFLRVSFQRAKTLARKKGIGIRLIPEEAVSVTESGNGVCVVSASGETPSDVAILTTGRCPDRDDFQQATASAGAAYFPTHIMSPALDDLPLDAEVQILGSSLSAFDVVNRLFSEASGCRFARDGDGRMRLQAGSNQRVVTLYSRSGRLKALQSYQPAKIWRDRLTLEQLRRAAGPGELTLRAVAALVREEALNHGAKLDVGALLDPYANCRSAEDVNQRARKLLQSSIANASKGGRENLLVDLLDASQVDLWDAFAERLLEAGEEQRYRRQFETGVQSYAAPAPIETGEKLLALLEAGRLRVRKGVHSVVLRRDGSGYDIEHDFGTDFSTWLINATGTADRDVLSSGQPALVRQLVGAGLLQPHARNGRQLPGAAVDMDSFRANGARNIYLANMLLWGPGFFTSSAFMMAVIVKRILDHVYS